MGGVLFYHLTRSPAEALVPVLIDKALAKGWRVELRGTDSARLDRFDDLLWTNEGFLPHGRAGGPHDARQPVLLTQAGAGAQDHSAGALDASGSAAAGQGRDCLVAIDGADVSAGECAGRSRVCILFDGSDSAALARARDQWRTLTAAGLAAEYWSEGDDGWRKQARSVPPAG